MAVVPHQLQGKERSQERPCSSRGGLANAVLHCQHQPWHTLLGPTAQAGAGAPATLAKIPMAILLPMRGLLCRTNGAGMHGERRRGLNETGRQGIGLKRRETEAVLFVTPTCSGGEKHLQESSGTVKRTLVSQRPMLFSCLSPCRPHDPGQCLTLINFWLLLCKMQVIAITCKSSSANTWVASPQQVC